MGSIDAVFARCGAEGRAAFIPYLTAGDPDLETTARLLMGLQRGGADLIELGVPFSDPIADGPVIQRASKRALDSGTTLAGILEMVARYREDLEVPLVLFSYFNPILARGVERFADQAAASGIDGLICVDLPPEEAQEELIPALRSHQVDTIFLLAPTSTRERVKKVAAVSRGFVYYVSRTGVTGEREELPEELRRETRKLRRRLDLPLAVGFGISTPDQVRQVAQVADGVVVGSALVHKVEQMASHPDLASIMEAEAARFSSPLRGR